MYASMNAGLVFASVTRSAGSSKSPGKIQSGDRAASGWNIGCGNTGCAITGARGSFGDHAKPGARTIRAVSACAIVVRGSIAAATVAPRAGRSRRVCVSPCAEVWGRPRSASAAARNAAIDGLSLPSP